MSDLSINTSRTPQPGQLSAELLASRAAFETWALDHFKARLAARGLWDARGMSYFDEWAKGQAWNELLPDGGFPHPEIDAAWESWKASEARAAAAAQSFLFICQEELVRTRITSLPQKLEVAKDRGLTLDEMHDWMRATANAFKEAVTAAGAEAKQRAERAGRTAAWAVLKGDSEHPEVLADWHAVVNGTPPTESATLPCLPFVTAVMLDRERQKPGEMFYLRVEKDEGVVKSYDLPGSWTPLDARRIARDMGFEPSHWAGPGGKGVYAFGEAQ